MFGVVGRVYEVALYVGALIRLARFDIVFVCGIFVPVIVLFN
jgi:hypothetical protein